MFVLNNIPRRVQVLDAEDPQEGYFRGWGINSELTEEGVLTYTTAIVEDNEGFVGMVHADSIRFINEDEAAEGDG